MRVDEPELLTFEGTFDRGPYPVEGSRTDRRVEHRLSLEKSALRITDLETRSDIVHENDIAVGERNCAGSNRFGDRADYEWRRPNLGVLRNRSDRVVESTGVERVE